LYNSSIIHLLYNSSTIHLLYNSSTIHLLYNSSTIHLFYNSSTIHLLYNSSTIILSHVLDTTDVYYKPLIQIYGACPDYIIIDIKNMNLKVKKVAIVWRAAGIYNLMTFHNVPEGCILFFKSYYANDPSF
jgi:hypothetical protein